MPRYVYDMEGKRTPMHVRMDRRERREGLRIPAALPLVGIAAFVVASIAMVPIRGYFAVGGEMFFLLPSVMWVASWLAEASETDRRRNGRG